MNISRTRLRAVAIPTVLAGLVLTGLAGGLASATPVPHAAGSPPAAPQVTGAASDFLFYVQEVPQPGCSTLSTVGLNASSDPAIDRLACAFLNFSATGVSGDLTVDLVAEGDEAPFLTGVEASYDSTDETYQASFEPDDTWPAGQVRALVRDAGTTIGSYLLAHNALVATLDAGAATAPGAPFTVTGEIALHSARTTFGGDRAADGATLTVEVVEAGGAVLDSQDVVADSSGAFSVTVPGSATDAEVTEDTTLSVRAVEVAYDDTGTVPGTETGAWAADVAGTTAHDIDVAATQLEILNSFVSSVGWVKPGDTYPSRIIVTNPTTGPLTPSIALTAPTGTSFVSASGPGSHPVSGSGFTWAPGAVAAGSSAILVLESKAATTAEEPTIVWRDLSSTAVMTVPSQADQTSVSHGPKVIPPSENYDTARYGDRPFPVVPVQYTDRSYQDGHSGESLESVINDPDNEGSTFNLYQEMSLGQLFPDGTVPSAGIASADFDYAPGFDFTNRDVPGNTCAGLTYEDLPGGASSNPLYTERITDGIYNLPGDTGYYGSDSNGSAITGSVTGVAALQDIDSGCGDTGKLVYDSAALADPEIDYSDYDTDKDGVVDFFMVVFAGCGGNGSSQLSVAGCDYTDVPYDNVWPHSSSLEYGYSDPVTGLPGYTTDDQLEDLEGRPLYYTDDSYSDFGPDGVPGKPVDTSKPVYVRVGPYNVNPETAIDYASVISHEYGHSLGLPDFYSTGSRETYGSWTLMAEDRSQNIDAYGRQELGWVVPEVLDSSRSVSGMTDSKEDTGTITWQLPDGSGDYSLTDGADGTVHNSQMYVAKLPGRQLLDESAFDSGATATRSHLWWSGSGNDYGCTPTAGHNFDLSIPELENIPADSTVTLSFKSRWDIEWDYDYGFVLTTTDGGETYTSHESQNGYTTGTNTVPPAASNNTCQDTYSNGLTGTSGSYQDGTASSDRLTSTYPDPVFLEDSYDISDLAGQANGALRFSYATDPGLARPGWFIDDLKVTVDPDGSSGATAPYDVFVTDFETSGGPTDTRVFNGGCREGLATATTCTLGWKFLQAGEESAQDHAYYLELRDRSGFDLDGNGEADRGEATFEPGLYLSYTDEAHGYGNAGTDDPPAQSPLDSTPEAGSETPELDDAAFTADAARSTYSDKASAPHVDNYADPSTTSGNWEFGYDCLDFTVDSMSGQTSGPDQADGDLTGDVTFTVGSGCGAFDYGYQTGGGSGGTNTAPVAAATATPSTVELGTETTLSAEGTTDGETPNDLDYSWDFGNGGSVKDAAGKTVKARYAAAGTYTAKVTVTDPQGLSSTATVTVVVKDTRPVAKLKITPKKPFVTTKLTLSGAGSTGLGLTYSWNFGDGGKKKDATGQTVRPTFKKVGYRTVQLTVTDTLGRTSTAKQRLLVRRAVSCNALAVTRSGSWRAVSSLNAPKGDYCDNLGRGSGRDTLTYRFKGKQLDIYHGRASGGGKAAVFVDGKRRGTIDFGSTDPRLRFRFHKVVTGLGNGRHTVRLVVLGGPAYLDSFISIR